MSSDWRSTTLGEVSTQVDYGYTASATNVNTGSRFLRITDIQDGVVDWRQVPYCEIDGTSRGKYLLHPGDIVVARTGNSTGENFLYQGGEEAVCASYLIRFRVDPSLVDSAYVWRCMRSSSWWNFIDGSKTGSAQAGANAKVLGLFEFEYPPLQEQKAIAHILGTLDDKIELNRKTNETLEAIAKALFKSWFVDFDPVRAKALGHPTGLPAGQRPVEWCNSGGAAPATPGLTARLPQFSVVAKGGAPHESSAEGAEFVGTPGWAGL